MPDFSQLGNPTVYTTALTIAVVASLETLLCVEATDRLDPYKRVTPTDRELKAQGLGNMISGLIGGLPDHAGDRPQLGQHPVRARGRSCRPSSTACCCWWRC